MNPGTQSIVIIAVIIFGASILGLIAGRRQRRDLENWTVGGRRFGSVLIWFLMGGEIYTTFTFLGVSGYAYENGAPAFYILVYVALGYALGYYYLMPLIWKMAKRFQFITQPDFFEKRFQSRWVAGLVALTGIAFNIPYIQLQLTGLGAIVHFTSRGAINSTLAMICGFVLVVLFVMVSGLRAIAWTSVVKDILMIGTVFVLGIGIPVAYFGGIGPLFHHLIATNPKILVLPGSSKVLGIPWFMSTVALTAMGFSMYPQAWPSIYSARDSEVIRRNAIFLPFYQISMLLMFFVGFSALIVLPRLSPLQGNFSLLLLAGRTFPAWLLGVIGGAGALAAMIPGAIIVFAAATAFSRNIYKVFFRPHASDAEIMRVSKFSIIGLILIGLFFAIVAPTGLVPLLLLSFDGMTQFFPAVVFSFTWRHVTAVGVLSGMLTGLITVALLVLSHHDPIFGINAGLIGLALNTVVTVVVSTVTQTPDLKIVEVFTHALIRNGQMGADVMTDGLKSGATEE